MSGSGGDAPPENVYARELSATEIAAGEHRVLVGGLWDELGRAQLEFLVAQGLRPGQRLLDVGCGCLRGGVHLARYLDPGCYFGLDVNASLIEAGLEVELPRAGLAGRVPRAHLLVNGRFEAWRLGIRFDLAWALSLFTHLPATGVRRCLTEIARVLPPTGRFFATYFEAPAGAESVQCTHQPGGITSYPARDPYHYRRTDLTACAAGLPFKLVFMGDWGHPRAQRMLLCERTPDGA